MTTVINEKTADKMTMQQVSELIEQKISERMSHRDAQDQQVRAYLQRLNTDRPAEGITLIETFRVMYDEHQDLRRRLNIYEKSMEQKISAAQGPAMPAHDTLSGLPPAVDAAMTAIQQNVVNLKQWQSTIPAAADIKMTEMRVHHIESQITGILDKQKNMVQNTPTTSAAAHTSTKFCSPSFNSGVAQPPPPGFGSEEGTPVGDTQTGMPAGTPGGEATRSAINGGGPCPHCVHVDQLPTRTSSTEARTTALETRVRTGVGGQPSDGPTQ